MTARLAEIWRHPIKAHGRERLGRTQLVPGGTLPFDRRWAIAHDASRFDPQAPCWVPCNQFQIGSKAPGLQAMDARLDEAAGRVTLSHPDLGTISLNPDDPDEAAGLIDWLRPLAAPNRPAPARVVRLDERGLTDTDYPSVSLINLSSHRAVAGRLGRAISHLRWRGNLIVEGLGPWEEMEWVGREIAVGPARLEVVEPITRCMATTASTRTGKRDADILGILQEGWGHQLMGVYARVVAGGETAEGDEVRLP